MRRWITIAVACQALLATYLQVVEWIDLFPWNNVAGGNHQEVLDVVILCVQVIVLWGFVGERLWLMAAGWAAYAGWLYLQIDSWWRPYLLGGRTVSEKWLFAHTYKFLPQIDQRPTPDACHVVLQVLIVAVLANGAIAIWQVVRQRRSSCDATGTTPA